jgi:hypothetical protein
MTGSKRHKFLAPEVLDEAAEEFFELARRDGIHTALVGGRAFQLYGSDRLTGDIDIASYSAFGDLPEESLLRIGGFKTHASNGTPADIIIRDDDYAALFEASIDDCVKLDNYPWPVASPEYLAAMKMVAGRGKDTVDLEWLILSGELDNNRARKIIGKYLGPYAAKEFDRLVDETEWKASRGR